VFLEDILNEARDVMLAITKSESNDKLSEIEDAERVADLLGVSAVVVQDLMAKRIKDYDVRSFSSSNYLLLRLFLFIMFLL